jgi:uncharacterized membrane protein
MRKERGSSGNGSVCVVVGVYDDRDDAIADYDEVKRMHADRTVGTYDAVVLDRDTNGKVHIRKHEKPTQHGAWSGLAAGALVGQVFPPGMIVGGIIGAASGGLVGHFRDGMSRSDLKELGELLGNGDAALVVIGEARPEEALTRALKRANRTLEKEVDADAAAFRRELDQAIDQARRG